MRAGRAQESRDSTDGPAGLVEHGFTLVEVLISVTILSIVIFVVVGGMNTLVIATALNRKQGVAGSVARRAAETVRNDQYVSCTNFTPSDTYPNLPTDPSQLPENTGLLSPRVAPAFIVAVTTLDGKTPLWTVAGGPQPGCTGANTTGIQSVQIEADSLPSPGVSQTIYVVKSQP